MPWRHSEGLMWHRADTTGKTMGPPEKQRTITLGRLLTPLLMLIQDGGVEGRVLIFWEKSKNTTHCWTTVRQENVGPHQNQISHVQGQRRSPSKMVGGEKSCLESNPIHTERLGGLKQNLVCTRRPHRDWVRPAFECLSVFCGGPGQQWPDSGAGALGEAVLRVA